MSKWKYEGHPGEIDTALNLLDERGGDVFAYEMQPGTISRLEANRLAKLDHSGPQSSRIILLSEGWTEVYRRREAAFNMAPAACEDVPVSVGPSL